MAPRAVGALLALVAALLLVASLAGAIMPTHVPTWWDGHPQVGAKTFEHKAIHVGLVGAYGCNLGETTTCESLDTGALLQPVGMAELVTLGLLALTTIALCVSIWRTGDRRKGLGRVVVLEALIAIAIAGAWFALGPNIKAGASSVTVPIGLGLYTFAGGAIAAMLAGVVARKVEREPLRLKTSQRMPAPAMAAHPPELAAFDVSEFVPLRPSGSSIPPTPAYSTQVAAALGQPIPMSTPPIPLGTGPHAPISRPMATPPTPPVTGPHAPIATPPQPLFENAPQLRPLYDMANIGVVPVPSPPPLPERAPTPIPRASFDVTTETPKNTPKKTPPVAATRTKAASLPPMRQVAPPSRTMNAVPGSMSKQPTMAHTVPPMPAMVPARAETDPEPATTIEIDAEAKAKWKAEQARKVAATAAVNVKLAAAARAQQAASVPPPAPPDTEQNPILQVPDPTDPIEARPTVAYSAQTHAALADTGAVAPISPELADTRIAPASEMPVLRPSDEHDAVGGPRTDVMDAVEAPTVSGHLPANEPAPTVSGPAPAAMPAVTIDKADFDKTIERNPSPPNRPSAPSLKAPPIIAVPRTIAPRPLAEVAAPPQRPTPSPDAKPVPLSTAPASLPPPKQAQPAQSGPTPACPQCEAPMAWVEEHLRFYCKQCRMYF
jgi:hypothetical protein